MQELVNGLLDFFISIFTIITSPIQSIIDSYMPVFNEFAENIGPVFDMINDWIPFIRDLTFVPFWAWQILVSYFIFKVTVTLVVNIISLVIQWWSSLVP